MERRLKRSKLEIFHDIISSIEKESQSGEVIPTRIQQSCNLSYDKFSKQLDDLKRKGLITEKLPLDVTDKGKQFLNDYGKIKDFLVKMKLEYLSEGDGT